MIKQRKIYHLSWVLKICTADIEKGNDNRQNRTLTILYLEIVVITMGATMHGHSHDHDQLS